KKVLADKKLGIDRDAKFVKPAELENEINSADIQVSDTDPAPGAEGDDQGVGNQEDYNSNNGYGDSLGPESRPFKDEDNNPVNNGHKQLKKDSSGMNKNNPGKKEEDNTSKPIGSPVDPPQKKKGLLHRIFDKKND